PHLLRHQPSDPHLQHHHVRSVLGCISLQHALCQQVCQRHWRLTVSQRWASFGLSAASRQADHTTSRQPVIHRSLRHGALLDRTVLTRE
ncbi:hypothetical protein LTR16_012560, partial [Cryomyces antarcticus]